MYTPSEASRRLRCDLAHKAVLDRVKLDSSQGLKSQHRSSSGDPLTIPRVGDCCPRVKGFEATAGRSYIASVFRAACVSLAGHCEDGGNLAESWLSTATPPGNVEGSLSRTMYQSRLSTCMERHQHPPTLLRFPYVRPDCYSFAHGVVNTLDVQRLIPTRSVATCPRFSAWYLSSHGVTPAFVFSTPDSAVTFPIH